MLSPGTQLGQFEVVGHVGSGGMGEVYRVRDSKLERDVAIKILPDAFARDSQCLGRFEPEARLLASLNHPNIVTIHDYAHAEAKVVIVVNFVEELKRLVPIE